MTWYPIIGPLSEQFRLIVPDIVGHGGSDRPTGDYDLEFYSRWLHDFLDALGRERLDLVGYSLGGGIALQFALDHPERVQRLALIDSFGLGRISVRTAVAMSLLMLNPTGRVGRWLLRHYLTYDPRRADEMLRNMRDLTYMSESDVEDSFARNRKLTRIFTPEELRRIEHPTLLIWAENDLTLPLSHGQKARQYLPDSRLQIIPKARHMVLFEQPKSIAEALSKFLAG